MSEEAGCEPDGQASGHTAGDRESGGPDERKRLMRAGARDRVRRWARASGTRVRRATPGTLIAVLAAGAFGNLLGDGELFDVLAGVGGNVLTDVLKSAVQRLRPGASGEETEEAIQRRIEEVLAGDGDRAAALRADIAPVLREMGDLGDLLREALGDQEEARRQVMTGLASLGEEFAEFRFLLRDVPTALESLRSSADLHSAQHQQMADLMHRQTLQTDLFQREITARGRPPLGERPSSPFPQWSGDRPYRGISAFQQGDAALFHGRAGATEELLRIVARTIERGGPHIVMVTGASGVGKSSLLRAGLLPALATAGRRPGQATGPLPAEAAYWPRIVMTPMEYGSPLPGLALHLAALAEKRNQRALREQLTAEPESAGFLVREAVLAEGRRSRADRVAGDDRRLVLVVDQFEQLFGSNGPGEEKTRAFVGALHAAAVPLSDAGVPALVVIAVRGDQIDNCARHPVLRQAQQDNQFVLGPMEEPDLRRAIVDQAEAAGLRIEEKLVQRILLDLRSPELADFETGTLPLVAQAMLLTWENREGDRLTDRAYELSGGVRRAVEQSAEEVYAKLTPEERPVAQDALRRLMFVGRDGRPACRRVALKDLPVESRPILEKFADKRLVVIGNGGAEPAHQVLLKAWPRLKDWLKEDIEDWKLYGRLADVAAQWASGRPGPDPSFLYQGRQLQTIRSAEQRWLTDPGRYPALERRHREFLDASVAAEDKRRRVWRAVLVSIAALATIAVVAGVWLVRVNSRSEAEHAGELSRKLAASSAKEADPVAAALLAAAAWRVAPTDEARYSLRAVLAGRHRGTLTAHLGEVRAVALSRDGRMMATGGSDSLIRLWDMSTRRPIGRPLAGHAGTVTSVAFGTDGRTLVSAGEDRTVQLWDIEGRRRTAPIAVGDTGPIVLGPGGATFFTGTRLWDLGSRRPLGEPLETATSSVAFSPDGRIMATADLERNVRLWDTAIARQIGPAFTGATGPLAFSPDGAFLLTSTGAARLELWDVAGRRTLGERPGCASGGSPRLTAFNGAGTIAVGCDDGSLNLWTTSGRPLLGGPLDGHGGAVTAVSFTPDETTMVSAAGENVRLWDVRDPVPAFLGDRNGPVAADRTGRFLATGASGNGDRQVRVWDLTTGRNTALRGQGDWTGALAFSPDGGALAAAADDRVEIWDVATGETRGILADAGPVNALAYSADGRSLVVASGEAGFTVRWWDVRSGRALRTLTPKVAPGEDMRSLGRLELSPDLRLLAAVQDGQSIRLWDLADGRPLGGPMAGHTGLVNDMAFSHDGRLVATAGSDDTVRLWDTTTRSPVGEPLTGHTGDVVTVAFSEDDRTLASGALDGTVRLWDTATRRQLGVPLTGPFESTRSLAFLPGRGTLASVEDTGTLDLWRVGEPPDLLGAVCATAGRAMTREEWRRYAPGEGFREVCDHRPAVAPVFPSAKDFHTPLPVVSSGPSAPPAVPATAAGFAGRYTLVLDDGATKAAFRREAPRQTFPLQQDITNTAGRYLGERSIDLEAACARPACAVRLTGFADGPPVTLARLRDGTFRGSAGHRAWMLRAATVTDDRVTTFTLTYTITDPTRTYSGSLGFRGARP
ncbi:hypothetical protein DQ384_11145 [Sphaerisporangium album]|uniref:Novel STAND NTPase 1 domain-containing protein n=1 Tax=Sphaerisporangium album TaxID=509200 RepID=A0A367FNS5_9ACTN|nr:AAA family ATPase [Sphaerisporangium album]RCG31275.1 hypothetical protein DQ384_11145 [Sphaerisporangium album]